MDKAKVKVGIQKYTMIIVLVLVTLFFTWGKMCIRDRQISSAGPKQGTQVCIRIPAEEKNDEDGRGELCTEY